MAGEIEILAWVQAKPGIYQSFWLIDYDDQSYPCLRRFMNLSILPNNIDFLRELLLTLFYPATVKIKGL